LAKTCNAFVKVSNNFKKLPIDQTSSVLKDTLREIGDAQGDQVWHGKSLTDLVASTEALNLEWNVNPTDIQIEEAFIEGPYTSVYKGYWNDRVCVVKIPNIDREVNEQEIHTMKHEISQIRKLFHPNLSTILCACIAVGWNTCYVLKFEPNGTLEDLLMDSNVDLSPQEAIQYAVQIAKGLLFLHENKPYCIHGNLKTSKILVQQDGTLAICDFGFKKSVLNSRIREPNIILEPEWLAPEVLMGSNLEDERPSDVYSFGLILFSIITRQALFQIDNPMILGYQISLEKITPTVPSFIPNQLVKITNQGELITSILVYGSERQNHHSDGL
jgi:serine/threonine protein kinase